MDCLNDALLPESTRKLWATICDEPVTRDFSGFVLVGGTALSLQIGHRVSEDLDFVWAHERSDGCYDGLPRQRIDKLIFHLRNNLDFHVEKISYPADEDDFANDGLNLDDFHQDYIIGGTKVTFFKASPDACKVLGCADDKSRDTPLYVASVHEIFLLKSLVVLERTKTRDYFDLYTLLKEYKVNLQDAHDVLSKSGTINGWDVFCERLSSLPVRKDDEGYHQMLNGKDCPSLEDMRAFFRDRLSQCGDHLNRKVNDQILDATKMERDFHNGTLPQPCEGMVTGTVRALVKDANANAFALVEVLSAPLVPEALLQTAEADGQTFAVPVSDADRGSLVIGETATFQAVAGTRHYDLARRPDIAATLDSRSAPGKETDCEP